MLISFEKFNQLIEKQKKLDNIIINRTDPINIVTMEFKRKFALLIEISEFANEVKWFKYWSKKRPDFSKAKEELIDVIHFTLSITHNYIHNNKSNNKIFYDEINVTESEINHQNIGENFFIFIHIASDPGSSIISIWKYLNMFITFIFDNENEVMKFYNDKNVINTKRQTIDNY